MMQMRHRELGVLAAIALAVLGLGWIVARDLRQSAEDASQLYERLSNGLGLIDELQVNAQEARRILLYALHTSDANLQLRYAEQSRTASVYVEALVESASTVMADRGRAPLDAVAHAWQQYLVVRDDVIGLILEGSLNEGVALDQDRGTARFNDVRQAIAVLKTSFESDAAIQVEAARARADRATARLTLLVVGALLTAAAGIYLINRRAALEGLLRIEAHKGSILQAVPDPILSADARGRIVELNEAAERTFGFTRADALGEPLEDMILPERTRAVLTTALARTLEAPRTMCRIETVAQRRDGAEFPIELAAVTHTAGADRIWTIHIADVTAQRQAEEQLRRAKEAAEAADRAKSDFLATMSHELRTPLTAVVGIADLLQGAQLAPAHHDLTRMLRSSASALLGLVSDILDYSRIEAGLMDLTPAAFAIQACVEEALDPVTEAAARKGLDIGCVIDPGVPVAVVADRERVRQVLLNLLSNAVKFTDAGEIAVHVGAEAAGDGSAVITVAVRDSGCGIPADLQRQLFQRFSQIQRPAKTRGGAGLGLAISARLSRLLGGTLSVDSAPGRGSTFTFVFRADVAPAAEFDDGLAASLAGMNVVALLAPGIVGAQIHSLLARWGAHASIVTSASPRSLRVERETVDAVVMDGDAWSGDRRTETLRALAVSCGRLLPVVLMERLRPSGLDDGESTHRVIAKPVRARALHDALCAATRFGPRPSRWQASSAPSGMFSADSLAILLVEDNDANRRVVQLMLEDLGLAVDEAADGQQAVERARARRYDVILMDVQMPGLDGLDAARQIRKEQQGKPPVILALTANVLEGDDARCREAGMDGYLPKPLRLDTLAAALAPLAAASS